MKTWYLMGQVTKRRELPAQIREAARRLGYLPDLESIRFEKGWSRVRNGQGVYCGIGFADSRQSGNDDPPEPPFDADTLVARIGMRLLTPGHVTSSVLPPEKAEGWTQESLMSGEAVTHVSRSPPPDPEDLRLARDLANETSGGSADEITERYDRLLCWLSCAVAGTWSQFAEACKCLGLSQNAKPGDVLVRLMLLGHIEIVEGGQRWSVNPPMLCEAVDGSWLMCGQRDLPLLEALHSHPSVAIANQPHAAGPACVRIAPPDMAELRTMLHTSGITVHTVPSAAERLAELTPASSEWHAAVRGNFCPDLASCRVEQLLPEDAGTAPLRPSAAPGGGLSVPPGLYVVTSEGGLGRSVRAYCDEDGAWTRCDWYGMAFLDQRRRGGLRAFACGGELLLPCDSPWPRMYERPLVLASGLLPVHIHEQGRLFNTHGSTVPTMLAAKLAIPLQPLGESEQ